MFLKTLSVFLIFYLVMMSIFTILQQQNYRREYAVRFNALVIKLQKCLSDNVQQYNYARANDVAKDRPHYSSYENLITSLNVDVNSIIADFNVKESYAKAALFTQNGLRIAKSGNLLRCQEGIAMPLQKGNSRSYWILYRFVDLDKYLSHQEIAYLLKLKKTESRTKIYNIHVSGYTKGAEVIPQDIQVFEEKLKVENETTSTKLREKLIKKYTFQVEDKDKTQDYEADSCEIFFEALSEEEGEKRYDKRNWIINDHTEKRFEACSKAIDKSILKTVDKYGFNIEQKNGLYEVKNDFVFPVEVNGEVYTISLSTLYYPWEIARDSLVSIYLFALAVVLLMAGILSWALWKTYKKEQLLEKNRRELADAIGHELKTPIGIIRTYSEGLKEKIAEEKRDHYLDIIIDETMRMDELILEMLDLSKLESKAYVLKREEFSLNLLIQHVLKNKEKLFNDKRLEVLHSADKEWLITADHKRIEQVISNLLINAIYHTPEMGKIYIEIADGKVSIENEGSHIPDEQMNLIWQAFYKDENTGERLNRRTGLGLSIVRNVLGLHQMPFGVLNTKCGVKFWFDFTRTES